MNLPMTRRANSWDNNQNQHFDLTKKNILIEINSLVPAKYCTAKMLFNFAEIMFELKIF